MKNIFFKITQIISFVFISFSMYGQVTVEVASIGNLDGRIEGFMDQVQATISNNTNQEIEANYLLTIVQTDGPLDISTQNFYTDFDFTLPPQPIMTVYSVRNMLDQFGGVDVEDFDFGSTPPGYEEYVTEQRRLPPGNYQTCLTVYSVDNPGEILGTSCLAFTVAERDPPYIQNPPDVSTGAWIAETGEEVFFNVGWTHASNFGVSYTLEIKKFSDYDDVTSFDRNDNNAFDGMANATFPIEDLSGFNYAVTDDDGVELEVGDFIALRLTAQSDFGLYLNEGRSNIVIAAYGVTPADLCDHPNFDGSVEWPIAGDTLPFRDLHYVVFIDPLCSSLKEVSGVFNTSDASGTTVLSTNFENRWMVNGGGPYNYMTRIAENIGWNVEELLPDSSYAQHFPLVHTSSDPDNPPRLEPNESGYRMSANIRYRYADGVVGTLETQRQDLTEFIGNSYHIGMPKPQLISPENNAILVPGEITLDFNTGNEPTSILPSFQILKINGNRVYNPYLNVQEKLVLQVSKDNLFTKDSIVFDGLRSIQASSGHPDITLDWTTPTFNDLPGNIDVEHTPDREYHEEQFLDQVYKNGSMSFEYNQEDTLYWRVVWLQNPTDFTSISPNNSGRTITNNDTYHISQTRRLIISNGGETPPEEPEETVSAECVSNCELPEITNTTNIQSLSVGQKFKAGKFDVTIGNLTSSSGSISGTGTILIPYLNGVNLMVEFNGIRVNTDRQMYSGDVVAIKDPTPFRVSQEPGTNIPFIDSTDVEMYNDWMNEGERVFDFLTGREVGLPIGIDREIDGRQVILGMVNATFSPRNSNVNFVAAVEVPELNTTISAGMTNVCIQPNGLTADSLMLYLPFDQAANFKNTTVTMKGGSPEEQDDICFMTFDCDGFKSMQIALDCQFPRSVMLPDSDGSPSTDENERAHFFTKGKYTIGEGLIMQFTMDPFYIVGADKVRFHLEDAYIDLSSSENPESINFPENYRDPSDPIDDTWEGFYMKRLSVDFADDLIESEDANVGVFDFIYDGEFTFKVGAYNVIRDGNISDWKATLDTISIAMTHSELDYFNVIGKLEPPIAAEGEYMNYRMVFDFAGGDDYYIQVDVEDSLNTPLLAANMRLFGDSYVRIGYSTERDAYIRANFSGEITIKDEYAGPISDIPGMSLPGIRFQEFLLDSDDGISCVNWDFAGLAGGSSTSTGSGAAPPLPPDEESGQGFAAGFPLSIDSIALGGGISSPKLYIKASLSLQQGSNGISAACALDFVGKIEDSKIVLDRVDLKGIYIDAEFSAVAIKGALEWEKTETVEEIRGAIGVKVPMGIEINIAAIFGTYKNNPTAPFGTAQHYNYWMVDGAVNLGDSGVPICSGIALFGIGGGVWHHMKINEELMLSSRETLDSPNATTRISNTAIQKYERDFNTYIGLRFNAVLGIQSSSSTLNLEVGILAEFSDSHGLSRLRVSGAVYVMQELGEGLGGDDGGMLYGQAVLEYRNTAETGRTFTGDIEVWLNVADVIKGGIDENDKLADVTFYADSLEWFFHMGSYNSETGVVTNGSAVKLSIAGQDIIKAGSYMMVGYGIPTELPLPPESVRDILGLGQTGEGGEFTSNDPGGNSSGDYSTRQRNGDSASFETGQGFAFGTSLHAELGFSAFIYLQLGLDLGYDVILAKMPYLCKDYGAPGINGWYAQGQAYAALKGDLGVEVKFFGTHRISIVKLDVAMLLQAKLPSPNYFKGSAGVRFSVLGGVFEGHKTIKIELGEKCEPLVKDPLANIQFIDKIEPNTINPTHSVFSTPTVSFSFPMNERLFLPKSYDAETSLPSSYYEFEPFVSSLTVKNKSNSQFVSGTDEYLGDNMTIQKKPQDGFAAQTKYDITCSVKVKDYSDGATHAYYQENGEEWIETKMETFKTGDYPDTIPAELVRYSYPLQGQRYFLQKETNNKGTIALERGFGSSTGSGEGLFYTEKDGENYEYVIRVTKANDFESTQDMPLDYQSGMFIPLDFPNLENEEIYLAQIVRKPKVAPRSNSSTILSNLAGLGNMSTNTLSNELLSTVFRKRLTQNSLGFSELVVRRLTPNSIISNKETKLYEFFFRTSKFDRLRNKLQTSETTAKTPSAISTYYASNDADVELDLEEGFDRYDLYGFYKNGLRVVQPFVVTRDPMQSDYWRKKGPKNIYQSMAILNDCSSVPVNVDISIANLPATYYINGNWPNQHYREPIYLRGGKRLDYFNKSSNNIVARPLNKWDLASSISENQEEASSSGDSGNPLLAGVTVSSSNVSLPGGFGGLGGFSLGNLPPTDDFFHPTGKKLLLQYSLSKLALWKWIETKGKINRFYYLQNNVVVKLENNIIMRTNLRKPIYEYMYENKRTIYVNTNIVNSGSHQTFDYVTSSYTTSEFNTRVSNQYQLWMAFYFPQLSDTKGAGRGSFHTESFLMEKDLTRIPQGTGPH